MNVKSTQCKKFKHYRAFDENINDDNGDENKEKIFRYCCSTKCTQAETCSLVGCIKSEPLQKHHRIDMSNE